MSHRMIGMVMNGFRINAGGSVDSPHVRQQVSEPVEGAEVRRRQSQNRDEGLLRFLPAVEGAEQHPALGFEPDAGGFGGLARDELLALRHVLLLRLARRPSAITAV